MTKHAVDENSYPYLNPAWIGRVVEVGIYGTEEDGKEVFRTSLTGRLKSYAQGTNEGNPSAAIFEGDSVLHWNPETQQILVSLFEVDGESI